MPLLIVLILAIFLDFPREMHSYPLRSGLAQNARPLRANYKVALSFGHHELCSSGQDMAAPEYSTVRDCPPSVARKPDGKVFHFCTTDPIAPDGRTLTTASERGDFLDGDPCQRLGISVYLSINDCVEFYKTLNPKRRSIWQFVAVASLNDSHGHIHDTPSRRSNAHKTWWPSPAAGDLFALFVVQGPL